jgi:uncharacterized membrane protein YidH (DUF202 family)
MPSADEEPAGRPADDPAGSAADDPARRAADDPARRAAEDPAWRAARDPVDQGLQAERTRLAWRRTALAATVCTLLLVRLALHAGLDQIRTTALGLTAGCWIGLLLLTQRRIRAMIRAQPVGVARLIPLTAAACVGLGLLGVLLIAA